MRIWLMAATIALILAPQLALAEAGNACRYLAKADQNAQPFEDQVYDATITYSENGRMVRQFGLTVSTKGMHKILINYTSPGEIRGMRVLVIDPETMYTYLPQFRRVRRVATHVRNQGVFGTNLSYEDQSEHRFSPRWLCTPHKTTDDSWILNLRPRPGIDTSYSKLRVSIGRKRVQYERVQYYRNDVHIKSQIREGWRTMAGLEMAGVVRYVSHDRNAETRVEFSEWRVNTGLSDSAFTRRALLRGGD